MVDLTGYPMAERSVEKTVDSMGRTMAVEMGGMMVGMKVDSMVVS